MLAAPPSYKRDVHSRAAVFLGSMMVSDITQRLKRRQMAVEQDGDAAVVGDGEVILRQNIEGDGNTLAIEGGLTPAFYEVREEVYKLYRLVAQPAEL
jgi:hypothetical protein